MDEVFGLNIVAQVHREVARFVIHLKDQEPVQSMRVMITEDMKSGGFTAWGDVGPRPLGPKGTYPSIGQRNTVDRSLLV